MTEVRYSAALLVAIAAGCRGQQALPPMASWSQEGADSGSDLKRALKGLVIKLEPSGDQKAGLPERLRLIVTNTAGNVADFVAPGPLCFGAIQGDKRIHYPLLRCVFWNAEGAEGDSSFGPIYCAEQVEQRAPPPEEVRLSPNSSWSREYPIASFYFVGASGPAARVEERLQSGSVPLKMALEVIELGSIADTTSSIAGVAGSTARGDGPIEHVLVPMTRRLTNSIAVEVADPEVLFYRSSDAYQAYTLAWEDRMDRQGRKVYHVAKPEEIPEILESFDEPEFSFHAHAADDLKRLGKGAIGALPRLLELLQHSKLYGDRVLAARVIGAMGPAAALAIPNLEVALKDPNGHVRQEAAAALALVRGEPAPEPLDPTTGEPLVWGKPVRHWITRMRLVDRGPNDRYFEEAELAEQALEMLGVKAVPALIDALRGDRYARRAAISILRKVKDPAGLELVAGALQHGEVVIRRGAAEALAPSRFANTPDDWPAERFSDTVIARLSQALRDPDGEVRHQAARALGRADARAAEGALADALSKDSEESVRVVAATSLGKLGATSRATLEALKGAAMDDESPAVRAAATSSVAQLTSAGQGKEDW